MKITPILFLLPALLLGACGQPSSINPVPTPITVGTTSVTLTVNFPAASVATAGIRPQYVPASTAALRVRIGAIDQTLNITTDSTHCTTTVDGTTCSFTLALNVAAGNNLTLTVDALDNHGTVLSSASKAVNINLGQDNPLSITLTGIAQSASLVVKSGPGTITSTSTTTTLDLGGTYTVGVALADPSGQTIVDPGRPDELLCSSNAAFVITGARGSYTVNAPDPTGSDQSTLLSVKTGADCTTGTTLGGGMLTVPAETLQVSLSNTAPVAGSTIVATATLKSALGQPLMISGRTVTFSTDLGSVPSPTQPTSTAGTVSTNVITSATAGTGHVSASVNGLSKSVTFTSTAGAPSTTTSTVVLSPASVKVGGSAVLTVTLQDVNGNPVMTAPSIADNKGATFALVQVNGNVFTYNVTAPTAPGVDTITASVAGNQVGQTDLTVTPYALVVTDGVASVTPGSQFNFSSATPETYTVSEQGYAGTFSVSASNTYVTVSPVQPSGSFTVTPGSTAGLTTITVTDTNGQNFTFDVAVTTATIAVN